MSFPFSKQLLPYHRSLNIRRGRGTRRTSESFEKSSRAFDLQEAFIEACCWRELDIDRTVERFETQPPPLPYEYEGVLRRAFSDVRIWRVDGTIAVREVKPDWARADAALQLRFSFIRDEYAKQDVDFALVYGDALFRLPRRHNVDLILRARHEMLPPDQRSRAVALICAERPVTIGELRAALDLTLYQTLSLVANGDAVLDLDLPITAATILTP